MKTFLNQRGIKMKHVFSNKNYIKGQTDPAYRSKVYAGHDSDAADGGETIPAPLANWFVDLKRNATWVRQAFETLQMDSATLKVPKKTAGLTMFHFGEGASSLTEGGGDGSSSSVSKTTWSNVTVTVDKVGVLSGWSTELAEDSQINIAEMVIREAAISMAEGEESAFIVGSTQTTGNELGELYTAGQPEKLYDGLIQHVPWASDSNVVQVSANGWTSLGTGVGDGIIDAAGGMLLNSHLQELMAKVNAQDGNELVDLIVMRPNHTIRLRDPVEFESFQTIDKIGADRAAAIKGFVGDYYGADVISSKFMPVGSTTSPGNFDDDTNGFVTGATDSLILGVNKRAARIAQRRGIEFRQEHNFHQDVEEIRVLERVGFEVFYPEFLSMIGDVKDAATSL